MFWSSSYLFSVVDKNTLLCHHQFTQLETDISLVECDLIGFGSITQTIWLVKKFMQRIKWKKQMFHMYFLTLWKVLMVPAQAKILSLKWLWKMSCGCVVINVIYWWAKILRRLSIITVNELDQCFCYRPYIDSAKILNTRYQEEGFRVYGKYGLILFRDSAPFHTILLTLYNMVTICLTVMSFCPYVLLSSYVPPNNEPFSAAWSGNQSLRYGEHNKVVMLRWSSIINCHRN